MSVKERISNYYHGQNNNNEKTEGFDLLFISLKPKIKWFRPPLSIKIFKWEISMEWAYKNYEKKLLKNCYPKSIDFSSQQETSNELVMNFSATTVPLDNTVIKTHSEYLKNIYDNIKNEEEDKQKLDDYFKSYKEYIKNHSLDDWDGDYIYDASMHAFRAPKYPGEQGDPIKFDKNCDLLEGNKPENDSDDQYNSCVQCYRFDICREYYSKSTEEKWFEKYVDMMVNKYHKTEWKIGWESLPKYIGHKIYNTYTKEIAVLNWDSGYPRLYNKDNNKDNNEVKFNAAEFNHGEGYWIYRVGENYNNIPNKFVNHLMSRFIKNN